MTEQNNLVIRLIVYRTVLIGKLLASDNYELQTQCMNRNNVCSFDSNQI
jgi:hypothetical protein